MNNNPIRLGNIYGENFGTGYAGNVWDSNAISPTLQTMQGGGRQPMIIEANVKGVIQINEKETNILIDTK